MKWGEAKFVRVYPLKIHGRKCLLCGHWQGVDDWSLHKCGEPKIGTSCKEKDCTTHAGKNLSDALALENVDTLAQAIQFAEALEKPETLTFATGILMQYIRVLNAERKRLQGKANET